MGIDSFGARMEILGPGDTSVSFATTSDVRSHAHALVEWLAGAECHDLDDAGLAEGLGRRLARAGLPLTRLTLHVRTMHPQVLGRAVAWSPGQPVEIRERLHEADAVPSGAGNPVRTVMETGRPLSISRNADGDFPRPWSNVLGGRHPVEYLALPLPNADGRINVVTYSTDCPGGFSPRDRVLLDRITPALRNACELRTLRTAELALLQTYVGATTAGRVLAGHVRRGQFENMDAALLLCDLREFTGISNTLSGERVLDLLNAYFDQVVPAITEAGGEVIKFMGDATLAFFTAGDPRTACATAVRGARKALEGVRSLNVPGANLRAGIALHYGSVGYGNIGSGARLDFTVIGRDVNLVSRIQGVCSHSGVPLLMSGRFASLISDRTVALGGHVLPGFEEPVDLYSLTELEDRPGAACVPCTREAREP